MIFHKANYRDNDILDPADLAALVYELLLHHQGGGTDHLHHQTGSITSLRAVTVTINSLMLKNIK